MECEAKYMIPRSPTLKTAYRSAKYQRPKMKIHGVWAFGFVLRIAVLEENTYHGSGLVQELLALTIEDIMKVCDEKKVAAPDTLVVVGDNTVKELKNTVLLSGVANYVNHSRFRFLDAVMPFGIVCSPLCGHFHHYELLAQVHSHDDVSCISYTRYYWCLGIDDVFFLFWCPT